MGKRNRIQGHQGAATQGPLPGKRGDRGLQAHPVQARHFRQRKTSPKLSVGERLRWKIENEGFNVQRNEGFNLEHGYIRDPTGWKVFYLMLKVASTIWKLLRTATCPQTTHQERQIKQKPRNQTTPGIEKLCARRGHLRLHRPPAHLDPIQHLPTSSSPSRTWQGWTVL